MAPPGAYGGAMRKPRLRTLSDHDITQEILHLVVEELLEMSGFDSNRAPRLSALLEEMERRKRYVAESYCTCAECMFRTGDGPDPRTIDQLVLPPT